MIVLVMSSELGPYVGEFLVASVQLISCFDMFVELSVVRQLSEVGDMFRQLSSELSCSELSDLDQGPCVGLFLELSFSEKVVPSLDVDGRWCSIALVV